MRLIVEDLPPVVSSAPKNVSDRVKFLDYNFFNEQPIKGADAYFFRWIFHNWSDKYSIRILQNTIPALKPGARIIINDNVLPDPGLLPAWTEERLRWVLAKFPHILRYIIFFSFGGAVATR